MLRYVRIQDYNNVLSSVEEMGLDFYIRNMNSFDIIFQMNNKIKYLNLYRDITDEDVDAILIKRMLEKALINEDATCIIVKNDNEHKIAFALNKLTNEEPKDFEERFKHMLKASNVTLELVDPKELLFIIQ